MTKGITVEEFLELSPHEESILVNLTNEDLSPFTPPFSTFQMSPTEAPNKLEIFSPKKNYVLISENGRQGEVLSQHLSKNGYCVKYLIGGLHSLQNHLVLA